MPIDPAEIILRAPRAPRYGLLSALQDIADIPRQKEEREAKEMDLRQQREERALLIEQREQLVEQNRRAQEARTFLGQSYGKYTTTDPTSGRSVVDYEGLGNELARAGYPEAAEGVWDRGSKIQKTQQDYLDSVLKHNVSLNAFKLAHLSGVEDESGWGPFRTAMTGVPGIDVAKIPEIYPGPEWVTRELAAMTKRGTEYQRAQDPQGYETKRIAQEQAQATLEKTQIELSRLRAAGTLTTQADFDKVIDDIVTSLPAAVRGAAKASAAGARGRVSLALRNNDLKTANDAIQDLYTTAGTLVGKTIEPVSGDATVELTPAGIDAAAWMFGKTGQLPPLGMGKAAAGQRAKIINRAAVLIPDLDIATNKAEFVANQDSLKKLQVQRDAIGAFEQTAMKNIDVFLQTAGKVVDTGSPLANRFVREASGALLGSPNQAAYDAARLVAVNEIAKITSNPNLSGQLSDSARHEVELFNPREATLAQSVSVMRLLKTDMMNRTKALDEQIAGIRARVKSRPGASTGAATSETGTGGGGLTPAQMSVNAPLAEPIAYPGFTYVPLGDRKPEARPPETGPRKEEFDNQPVGRLWPGPDGVVWRKNDKGKWYPWAYKEVKK